MRNNHAITAVTAMLGSAMLASSASAAVLLPGGSANLSGWVPASGGNTIFSQSYAFTAIQVPQGSNAATGVLHQTITQQTSGELLFGLRIDQFSADAGVEATTLEMAGWKNFTVDADYLLASGMSSPQFIERSGFNNGGNLTWSQFSGPMDSGKSSAWMQVLTNAAGFVPDSVRLTLSFSDGSRAVFNVAGPSSIPTPGAAALLLGASLCVVRRRR